MAQSLFSGTRAFSAGLNSFGPFAVPGNAKQPGVALWLGIFLDGDAFPNGTTRLQVEFSFDGGATWRGAATDCIMPRVWRTTPHLFGVSYAFGTNDNPTHARASLDAPSAFSAAVTLQVR